MLLVFSVFSNSLMSDVNINLINKTGKGFRAVIILACISLFNNFIYNVQVVMGGIYLRGVVKCYKHLVQF